MKGEKEREREREREERQRKWGRNRDGKRQKDIE